MGLLQARETERIGAGPAGFIQIQTHPWFREVDWEAVLRREVRAPWVPPSSGDSAVDQQIDFEREDVRAHPPAAVGEGRLPGPRLAEARGDP